MNDRHVSTAVIGFDVKVEVGELVNRRLSGVAAIHHDIQQRARRQIDAARSRREFAATILTVAILGSPARRDAADGRARQCRVKPQAVVTIAQDAHQTRRIGRQRGPDNRTYQRRQEHPEPAISVKVT